MQKLKRFFCWGIILPLIFIAVVGAILTSGAVYCAYKLADIAYSPEAEWSA